MQTMYDDRVKYKKLLLQAKQEYENTKEPRLLKDIAKYNNIQLAKKISLNSAYGVIGNNWFRYYDLLVVEAITTSGQLSIRWIESVVNEYLNGLLKTDNEDYIIETQIQIQYMSFLTNLLIRYLKLKKKRDKIQKELSHSWILWIEINLNLLLIRVIRVCISM